MRRSPRTAATSRPTASWPPITTPFRQDTVGNHRSGAWFKEVLERALELSGQEQIHNRGCHYVALSREAIKPDGTRYQNTEEDWHWLEGASKAARWLGYVEFDVVSDERNAEPDFVPYVEPEPQSRIAFGDIEVMLPDELVPRPVLDDFRGIQPYKLVVVGEKTSLRAILLPIAQDRKADLYLPTGESSNTLIYGMARDATEEGRPLRVVYFSDCDPEGYGMARNVAHKLRAFRELAFPDLEFEVFQVALTPAQVREHGLPSTPILTKAKSPQALKAAATKRQKWVDAHGIEQTEIDSIATLQPDLLRDLALRATRRFYDPGLDRRAREIRRQWEADAQQVLADQLGAEQLEQIRRDGEAKLAELEEQIEAINDALRIDEVEGIELPDIPDTPIGRVESDYSDGEAPLCSSEWDFAEHAERLIAHKRYTNV
jgi:hypothetical protein